MSSRLSSIQSQGQDGVRLSDLARQLLLNDGSVKRQGEFEDWLETALDKAPEYDPIQMEVMDDCTCKTQPAEILFTLHADSLDKEYEMESLPLRNVSTMPAESIGPNWLEAKLHGAHTALRVEQLCSQTLQILAANPGIIPGYGST